MVTGPNGSGKSTLLRTLAGLLDIKGQLCWNGLPIGENIDAYRHALAYIGHLDALKPELSIAEQVDYWSALDPAFNRAQKNAALDYFALSALDDRRVSTLSAGQRRRLSLTRLMLKPARLWLLDEPMTALDSTGQRLLEDLIALHRAKGGAVIIATHQTVLAPHHHILEMGVVPQAIAS